MIVLDFMLYANESCTLMLWRINPYAVLHRFPYAGCDAARPSAQPRGPKEVARAAATLHVPRPTARAAGTAKQTGCRHSTL